MLSARRESLAGKLLLSTALVAVSLGYGWWQTQEVEAPKLAMAPMPVPPVKPLAQSPPPPVQAEAQAEAQAAPSAPADAPVKSAPQKSAAIANVQTAAPQAIAPSAAPATPAPQPATEQPAPVQLQAMQTYVPTDGASPPFPLVTGTPEPGATVPLPPGTHLADGESVSSRHSLMWGDLKVRIMVQGGVITGVQVLQYPDHRSQSLYLSQLALPILAAEVIKNQKAQVDAVSSATDTSYTFQDAVAEAIAKATRG